MIRLIYSKRQYAAKPTDKYEVSRLQSPANYVFAELESVDDVASLIGEGRAWRAGLYDSGIDSFKKQNVAAAQILALDFDCCPQEPETIIQYAESIGIGPSAWYWSYSQGKKEGNNFRVLWILEEAIKPIQYETIIKIMMEQFAQFGPDKSTKDASRLWFGTDRGVKVLLRTPIKLSTIGWLGVCDKMREGQPVGKAKKAVKACEKDFFEDEAEEVSPVIVQQTWRNEVIANCWLLDRWENGKYLNYNQRLTLFSNLKYLKYGNNNLTVLKEVLETYRRFANVYEGHTCNEEQLRSMFVNTTLRPLGIVRDAQNESPLSIPEYLALKKQVENKKEKITLEELDNMLKEQMPQLLNSGGVVYIQSQTASGKTQHIIEWILQQDLTKKKIIYSTPRYTNIEEFKERFFAAYVAKFGANPLLNMEDIIFDVPKGRYDDRDLFLMEMGFPPKTRQNERYSMILRMLNPAAKGLFIATHECIAHLRACPQADCVIIDENIEDALIDTVKLDIGGLSTLIPYVDSGDKQQTVLAFINELKDMEEGEIVDISQLQKAMIGFKWDEYLDCENPMKGAIKLTEAQKQPPKVSLVGKSKTKAVRLTTKSNLIADAIKKQIPIKLLSATPKPETLTNLYRTDLGDKDIEVYSFPLAKNNGVIIQFLGITGGKGLEFCNLPRIIKYVKTHIPKEELAEAYVLSFKNTYSLWEKEGFKVPYRIMEDGSKEYLHLQNNAGLDFLKGKIVIVAGKYDLADEYYLDLYYDIHPNSNVRPQRKDQYETINDRLTLINLWDDADLKKIQIENIKMYLEQSAGRARALREKNAKVYLIANFPIDDADYYDDVIEIKVSKRRKKKKQDNAE